MKIVIEGAGEVGSHLAKLLRQEGNEVTVIDDDKGRLEHLIGYADVETLQGYPASIQTLKDAGVAESDLFIAVYPSQSQEINIVSSLLAGKLGAGKVIARINDEEFISSENRLMFKELGIEMMLYPERSAADEIVDQLKRTAMSDVQEFARGKLQIGMFRLDEDSPLLDIRLGDFMKSLSAEDASNFRIIAISRDGKTIIPKFDSKFFFGDMVFTISNRDGLEALAAKFGKAEITTRSLMILGGGAISEMVARTLSKQGIRVKIIESDRKRCIELTGKLPSDVEIVCGDPRNSDFLFEEGLPEYDALASLTASDEANVLSCVVARKFGVQRTIAEVENNEYIRLAEEMGVDAVINKKLITASRIFRFTLDGRAGFVRYMSGTDAEILEYTVAEGSAITKGPLKTLNFPEDAIVGGIIRGNETIIAVGDTEIQAYDRVAIFAKPNSIKTVDKFFK